MSVLARASFLAITLLCCAGAGAQTLTFISATPSPATPKPDQPFVLRITGITNLNIASIAAKVDVSPGRIAIALSGDCGFLCPGSGLSSAPVQMPGIPAGTYQVTITGLGISGAQLALTIGAAPPVVRDYADLWFNPSESGWGLTLHQQGTVIFGVLFVYGSDGKPTWFVAPDLEFVNSTLGNERFSGALYRTNGPAFNAARFDPAAVGVTQVGTLTFLGGANGFGTAEYTIDGASFSKPSLERQTWRGLTAAGNYAGAVETTLSGTGCPTSAFDSPSSVTASFAGPTLTLAWTFVRGQCSYTGDYVPTGRIGHSNGTFTCAGTGSPFLDGSGPMAVQDITRGPNGFGATATGTIKSCTLASTLAGLVPR